MYRIGICDDDKRTCSHLEELILEYAKVHFEKMECYVWFCGDTLCNYLQSNDKLDLLFLDIELAEINGIEVGSYIRDELEDMHTSIVFISSKSNYAMKLFKVQPLDFLIKPLTMNSVRNVLDMWFKVNKTKNELFKYKSHGSYFYLPYSDIIYFNSENKKINIILKNNSVQFNGKLKDLYPNLPGNFIMIHQSYIINCEYISECSYVNVELINGSSVNISQAYRKEVRERLKSSNKEKKNV